MPTGSNFDDFLREQGCLEEAESAAREQVNSWKSKQAEDHPDLASTDQKA